MVRSHQRAQSVVEFGIIALLFTLIMFAIVDFGLILNDWLSVSTGTRVLARDAAVGAFQVDLVKEAKALKIPGVNSADCCSVGQQLVLNVAYYDQCTPGVGVCNPVDPATLSNKYASNGVPGGCTPLLPPAPPCAHPSPPKAGSCNGNPTCPGDSVVLTLTAAGAQVITPLVRPFFSGPNCLSSGPCYVPVSSVVVMRFEGDIL